MTLCRRRPANHGAGRFGGNTVATSDQSAEAIKEAAKRRAQERRDKRKQELAALAKVNLDIYDRLVATGGQLDQLILPEQPDDPPRTERRRYLEDWLFIRDKGGHTQRVHMNRCQLDTDLRAGKRNIILKARQVGITTYVAARFFISTIAQPGTLSVQVAHDQQSAEQIFRIVHRFLENLPE